MKHLSESKILKKFTQPPGGQPPDPPKPSGSISVFPSSPLDLPPETLQKAIKRREENHQMLIQWIQKNLKPDIHYGRIHVEDNCKFARASVPHQCHEFSHMSMITLYKAGAEMVLRCLGLTARFPNVHEYVQACVFKQEIQMVVLKCELRTSNGTVVAEGTGSRHIKQDSWDLNKTIKMAAKSGMIDATIRVAGLSDIFIKTHRHTMTKLGDCNTYTEHEKSTQLKLITQRQKNFILELVGKLGLTIEGLNKRCKSSFNSPFKRLQRHHASNLIHQLKEEF